MSPLQTSRSRLAPSTITGKGLVPAAKSARTDGLVRAEA